jgi:hypothetical protein
VLFVMTLQWRDGLTQEQRDGALIRRAAWDIPSSVKMIGEWWPASNDLAVVVVFEADSFDPILEIGMTWEDVFKLEVHPAISAEDGLRMGPEVMSRISR